MTINTHAKQHDIEWPSNIIRRIVDCQRNEGCRRHGATQQMIMQQFLVAMLMIGRNQPVISIR